MCFHHKKHSESRKEWNLALKLVEVNQQRRKVHSEKGGGVGSHTSSKGTLTSTCGNSVSCNRANYIKLVKHGSELPLRPPSS